MKIKRIIIISASTALTAVLIVFSALFFLSGTTGKAEAKSDDYISKAGSLGKIARKVYSGSMQKPPIKNEYPSVIRVSVHQSELQNNLLLVNYKNPLPSDYAPRDLISSNNKSLEYSLPSKTANISMDRAAMLALSEMFQAAEQAGLKGMLISNAYRSVSLQDIYYRRKIKEMSEIYDQETAVLKASAIVAPPGKSEHQTGLAVDITTREILKKYGHLPQAFADTAEGRWLAENSWKYGFILRYASDKSSITGIINEPWHFRYVGAPHAEIMYWNNLCLEEYLQLLETGKPVQLKTADGQICEVLLSGN